MDDEDMIDE
jgi:hypothetical protein